MRIAHTADLHLGVSRYGRPGQPHSRLDDFEEMCQRFVAAAEEHEADLAIVAGDLFNSRQPRPRELAVAARFLTDLAGECPVALAPGNHDGMAVIGDPSSMTLMFLAELDLPNVHVLLAPGVTVIAGARIVSIPYPHKRAYDLPRPDLAPIERQEALVADLSTAIDGWGADAPAYMPSIFVGHLAVAGGVVESERAMRLEDDLLFAPSLFDVFDYAALGHLHRQQQVGRKAWYPGAPEHITFAEAGDAKGFLIADVERGENPVVITIPSGARPMVILDHDGSPGWARDMPDGAIVRIRMAQPTAPLPGAVRALTDHLYAAGASYVDTEVILPAARALAPRALRGEVSDTEAMKGWLSANGYEEQPYLAAAEEVFHG